MNAREELARLTAKRFPMGTSPNAADELRRLSVARWGNGPLRDAGPELEALSTDAAVRYGYGATTLVERPR